MTSARSGDLETEAAGLRSRLFGTPGPGLGPTGRGLAGQDVAAMPRASLLGMSSRTRAMSSP